MLHMFSLRATAEAIRCLGVRACVCVCVKALCVKLGPSPPSPAPSGVLAAPPRASLERRGWPRWPVGPSRAASVLPCVGASVAFSVVARGGPALRLRPAGPLISTGPGSSEGLSFSVWPLSATLACRSGVFTTPWASSMAHGPAARCIRAVARRCHCGPFSADLRWPSAERHARRPARSTGLDLREGLRFLCVAALSGHAPVSVFTAPTS